MHEIWKARELKGVNRILWMMKEGLWRSGGMIRLKFVWAATTSHLGTLRFNLCNKGRETYKLMQQTTRWLRKWIHQKYRSSGQSRVIIWVYQWIITVFKMEEMLLKAYRADKIKFINPVHSMPSMIQRRSPPWQLTSSWYLHSLTKRIPTNREANRINYFSHWTTSSSLKTKSTMSC